MSSTLSLAPMAQKKSAPTTLEIPLKDIVSPEQEPDLGSKMHEESGSSESHQDHSIATVGSDASQERSNDQDQNVNHNEHEKDRGCNRHCDQGKEHDHRCPKNIVCIITAHHIMTMMEVSSIATLVSMVILMNVTIQRSGGSIVSLSHSQGHRCFYTLECFPLPALRCFNQHQWLFPVSCLLT